jgi:hypothetical protein
MKSGIAAHLSGQKSCNIIMAKDILYTLASSATTSTCRGVAGVLGVDRQNIRKGIDRRVQLDGLKRAFWTNYRRSVRSDCISEATKDVVQQWWTTETQISPNRKDIRRRLKGTGIEGDYEEHPTHYLQTSEVKPQHFPEFPCSSDFRCFQIRFGTV